MKRKRAPSVTQLHVDDLTVELTRKPIKNVYLRVSNPGGRVRLSAPQAMAEPDIIRFVREHREWIRRRQARVAALPSVPEFLFESGESHAFFGTEYRLVVLEQNGRPAVQLTDGSVLRMTVPPETSVERRAAILDDWYRMELGCRIQDIVARWEPVMGVSVSESRIRRMRTRWGTCNIRARRIWLNLELARRPEQCLEYVVVHEMNHLLERGHTRRFYELMDTWLPDWRISRKLLSERALDPG